MSLDFLSFILSGEVRKHSSQHFYAFQSYIIFTKLHPFQFFGFPADVRLNFMFTVNIFAQVVIPAMALITLYPNNLTMIIVT